MQSDFREKTYNEAVFASFAFGVDDAIMSVLDAFSGERILYTYWTDEERFPGQWCYVGHDEFGNYYEAIPSYACAEIGLRLDFPVSDKYTVAKLRLIAKERGIKGLSRAKKADVLAALRKFEAQWIEWDRTEAERIGRANAEEALDQIALFSSLEEALDNYLVNASDTLGEQGLLSERDASDMQHGFEAVLIERRIGERPHGL